MENKNLTVARNTKNDEFYTRMNDIETEISMHADYVKQFEGKTVLCNCNDLRTSGFFLFFEKHFQQLKMKKLITTDYNKNHGSSFKREWEGEIRNGKASNVITTPLKGDGDFRSPECVELLKEADIVVTNPPFSLFREYVQQLVDYDKKFIIIGNKNAIAYKELFPLLKENKVWLGYNNPPIKKFDTPNGETSNIYGLTRWYTNLDIDKRHEPLPLTHNYTGREERYPKYDNYDAIEVSKSKDIPKDYDGVVGVPISFMDKYDPDQFKIIQFRKGDDSRDLRVKGKFPYFRILIRYTDKWMTSHPNDFSSRPFL